MMHGGINAPENLLLLLLYYNIYAVNCKAIVYTIFNFILYMYMCLCIEVVHVYLYHFFVWKMSK